MKPTYKKSTSAHYINMLTTQVVITVDNKPEIKALPINCFIYGDFGASVDKPIAAIPITEKFPKLLIM